MSSVIDSFVIWFKKNQPIDTTGMFTHVFSWIATTGGDYCYKNPNFSGDEDIAIYCIHGTADRSASFQRMAERLLEKDLPSNISSINLVSFESRYQGKGIAFFAKQLADKIKANGHKKVILMGHSRGGLVIAHFAQYLAKEYDIEVVLVLSICAPFGGSYLALAPMSLFSRSVGQMQINSVYLKNLNTSIEKNAVCPYVFITAEEDGIVTCDCAFISKYVAQNKGSLLVLDRHGHLSIMSSHRLVDFFKLQIEKHVMPKEAESEPKILIHVPKFTIIEDYIDQLPEQSNTITATL